MWICVAILKWIGILLGAVLGLCLFLAALVIFVPVRYYIRGSSQKEFVYSFKFSWLFSILSVKKREHSNVVKLYFLGIPIRRITGGEERKKKTSGRKPVNRKLADQSRAEGEPERKKEEPPKKTVSSQGCSPASRTGSKRTKKNHIWNRKRRKSFSFTRVSSIIGFVKQNGKTIRRLLGEIRELVRYLSPTKMRGEIVLGTGDPASTGLVFGGLSLFPVFYQDGVHITPDFEEKRFEAQGYIKGRLRLLYFLRLLFRFYKDSELKHLWKQYNKVKKEAA